MPFSIQDRMGEKGGAHAPVRSKIRELAFKLMEKDSVVPIFSASARKLMELTAREDVSMDEVVDVVSMDPGLAAKFLRLANSSFYGNRSIATIEAALLRIGMAEVRKIAMAAAAMEGAACFWSLKDGQKMDGNDAVEWEMFWTHSLLVARLTEEIANAFRPASGKEYLAGLLHDIGKLFLGCHFPNEFKAALQHSMSRHHGEYEAEKRLFDLTHAEVGWALCERWKLHREIGRGIRFHHEPNSPFNKDPIDPEYQHFLADCIEVADGLANLCGANILSGENTSDVNFESLQGWRELHRFTLRGEVDLDMGGELENVRKLMGSLGMAA
ncbi:MAG: HDOD domain-containing protein [Verrucomicrobiae bacterium]|nr:HDOD domain-containing protein [Verrucomicrobiae bacterium]